MHLTYHDSKPHTSEASTAKAEEAGAPDTRITPAMISAGLDVFLGLYPGGGETEDWFQFAQTVLVPTYLAMERAKRAAAP